MGAVRAGWGSVSARQVGSGGAGLLWKIFRAKPKSESKQKLNAEVCVWLLDKRALAEERTKKGTR